MYPKSLSADAASWLQSWFCYFLVNEFTEMESVNRSSVPNQRRDIGAASHIFEDRCRLRSTWPEPGSNESWSDQYPVTFKTVNQSCSGFRAAKEREKHLTVWWYRQEGQGWLAVAEAATKKKEQNVTVIRLRRSFSATNRKSGFWSTLKCREVAAFLTFIRQRHRPRQEVKKSQWLRV